MKTAVIFAVLLLVILTLDNGLGITPPMGWNSWNHFGCNINETTVRQTVDFLISTGLAAKGYNYVNLDDCWQIARNVSTNQIIEDKSHFPSGIAALSAYIHSKGLKFGVYSDAGFETCAGRPGSLNYEEIDAKTYAKWGVDFLKYDNCNDDGTSSKGRYKKMRDALNATGRPIFFSMCSWGNESPWEWAKDVGNSWRTTLDMSGRYNTMVEILDQNIGLSMYAGPGGWNDPDLLEVGNGLMTNDEYQAHFALWAAIKAPLIFGCGLSGATKQTLDILGNDEVIAVNQDPLGKQAELLLQERGTGFFRQTWGGLLSQKRFVLVCFNRDDLPTTFKIVFDNLVPGKVTKIREIIDKTDINVPADRILTSKIVRTLAVAMYVVSYV